MKVLSGFSLVEYTSYFEWYESPKLMSIFPSYFSEWEQIQPEFWVKLGKNGHSVCFLIFLLIYIKEEHVISIASWFSKYW